MFLYIRAIPVGDLLIVVSVIIELEDVSRSFPLRVLLFDIQVSGHGRGRDDVWECGGTSNTWASMRIMRESDYLPMYPTIVPNILVV